MLAFCPPLRTSRYHTTASRFKTAVQHRAIVLLKRSPKEIGNTRLGTGYAPFQCRKYFLATANAHFTTRNAHFASGNAHFGAGNAHFATRNVHFEAGIAAFGAGNAHFVTGDARLSPEMHILGAEIPSLRPENDSFGTGNADFVALHA